MTSLLLCILLFQTVEDEPLAEGDIKVDYTAVVTMVNLPVKVHQNGLPHRKLAPRDLSVVENGVKVDIEDVRKVQTPLRVQLLFDLSVSNERYLDLAERAVGQLLDGRKKGDLFRLSGFSDIPVSLTEFTDDTALIKSKLNTMRPVGTTAFYDAMYLALDDLNRVNGSRVLVVFSDGHDLISRTSQTELATRARNFQIPIVFVNFSKKRKKSLLKQQQDFIRGVVTETGGAVIDGTSAHGRDLRTTLDRLRFRYLIRFMPPGPDDLEQWRRLEVQIAGCTNCRIEHRRAYQLKSIQ